MRISQNAAGAMVVTIVSAANAISTKAGGLRSGQQEITGRVILNCFDAWRRTQATGRLADGSLARSPKTTARWLYHRKGFGSVIPPYAL